MNLACNHFLPTNFSIIAALRFCRGGSRMRGAPGTLVFASHLHIFDIKTRCPSAPLYIYDMSAQNCAVRSRKTWGHKQPRGPKNLRTGPPESAGPLALAQSAPPLNPPLRFCMQRIVVRCTCRFLFCYGGVDSFTLSPHH